MSDDEGSGGDEQEFDQVLDEEEPEQVHEGEEEEERDKSVADGGREGTFDIMETTPLPAASASTAVETVGGPTPVRDRRTTRFMTKYERARVLGTRALQIRFVNE